MTLPEITMQNVADAAGAARSTVSKALRNDPTISVARCRQIQTLADKLGYRPNPLVAALMSQLHHCRRRSDPHHLAWLDLWPPGERSATSPFADDLLAGARERAASLGYAIEVHPVARQKIAAGRLRQILAARAQWGVMIPPVPESAMHYSLDLRGLTAVTLGTSLREPAVHRVSSNHFQGAALACEKLRAKGFERIGLALSPEVNARVDGKWCGAFLAAQVGWPQSHRIAPLLASPRQPGRIERWLARVRPDALLLSEPHFLAGLRGRPVPRLAWLVLRPERSGDWGIDHRPRQIGGAALELLVGQIHRNERGLPLFPHTVLLDGQWSESRAARPISPRNDVRT